MISPFLELDEERRKRDAMFREKLGNVGSSLVAAPLTYDKLMKDSEDRRTKLESDRTKMQQAKEEHELSQSAGKLNMEQTEQEIDIAGKGQVRKERDRAIESQIGSGMSRQKGKGFEMDNATNDQMIMKEAIDNPAMADVPPEELEAGIKSTRDDKAKADLDMDLKQQGLNIKKQDADTRKNRATNRAKNAGVKYEKLPVGMRAELLKIRTGQNTVAEIANKKKTVDTGLLSTFGSTVRQMLKAPEAERAVFDQEVQRLFNQIVKDQSGATVTAQEMSRQLAAFPDRWNDDAIFEVALEAYALSLEDKETILMNTLGSEPAFKTTINEMTTNKKPLPAKVRAQKPLETMSAQDLSALSDEELKSYLGGD